MSLLGLPKLVKKGVGGQFCLLVGAKYRLVLRFKDFHELGHVPTFFFGGNKDAAGKTADADKYS